MMLMADHFNGDLTNIKLNWWLKKLKNWDNNQSNWRTIFLINLFGFSKGEEDRQKRTESGASGITPTTSAIGHGVRSLAAFARTKPLPLSLPRSTEMSLLGFSRFISSSSNRTILCRSSPLLPSLHLVPRPTPPFGSSVLSGAYLSPLWCVGTQWNSRGCKWSKIVVLLWVIS